MFKVFQRHFVFPLQVQRACANTLKTGVKQKGKERKRDKLKKTASRKTEGIGLSPLLSKW